MENNLKQENTPNEESTVRSLREKVISRNGLVVLIIVLLVGISILLWQLDIDWERHIDKYGFFGVFVLSFVSSLTILFPMPAEAVLAAAPGIMGLEGVAEISRLGFVASVGAALGELSAYFAGYWGRAIVADKYKTAYARVDRWMRKYGGPAIFIFSFTPLPFDLVGIAAGSLKFPIWKFLFYCWAGRLARALLIVHLGTIGWHIFFG